MDDLDTLLERIIHALMHQEPETALLMIKNALEQYPEDARLHYQCGKAYNYLNCPDKGFEHFLIASQKPNPPPHAFYELGLLSKKRGDERAALNYYHQALQLAPDFGACHEALGQLFLQQKQFEYAKKQYQNVLALWPQHVSALFNLGVIALLENDLPTAQSHLEQALEIHPEDVETLTNLGVIALKTQEPQLAIAYFTKALAIDNDHQEARSNLAATFMHFDRFDNALVHYQILLEVAPQNIEYLYNSGVALMAIGHFEEAVHYFERVLAQVPEHFESLSNLAAIELRRNNIPHAKMLYKKLLSMRPDASMIQFMNHVLEGRTPQQGSSEYVSHLFDQYALYYDKHMQEVLSYTLPQHLSESLKQLHLAPVESILDLGAGTGLSGECTRPYTKCLIGVDLSEKMLHIAQKKGLYDELHHEEALAYLTKTNRQFDWIVALDLLPYFGALDNLFDAIDAHLAPEGLLIFSTEISDKETYQLQKTARFSHHADYLHALLEARGFISLKESIFEARRHEDHNIPLRLMIVKKR